jgi:predicted RNA-binding protein YlxR (DUF448 family)
MKRRTVQTETMQEDNRAERPAKPGPTRTCAGCGQHDDAAALVRVVLGPRVGQEASSIAVDVAGGSFGRGAHVHAQRECLTRAAKGGLARAFKCRVQVSAEEIALQIVEGCNRRIAGLLLGARRAGHVSVGADAAAAALGKASDADALEKTVLVVARDAASVVERGVMAEAIADGRAIAWGNKAELGALMGRDEVAVCAVAHASVAEQLIHARKVADAVIVMAQKATKSRSGDAWMSREVR